VKVPIPGCLVDTGYRRDIQQLYRKQEEERAAHPSPADPLTAGLGALLRGFKHSEIYMLDLAKKEHFSTMVDDVVIRAESMYGKLDENDRNPDAVGRVGLAIGLDGNPMYTGASAKTKPIVSLSFPATASGDTRSGDGEAGAGGLESKDSAGAGGFDSKDGEADETTRDGTDAGSSAESDSPSADRAVPTLIRFGVNGKFHTALNGKKARGKLGAYFSDPVFSIHRTTKNQLQWVNSPGDPRQWHIEFLQDVLAQFAVASLETARYLNLVRAPTEEEVYGYMIARAGQCETAEYHLFLLTIDVCLLQLAQCELSGESRQWERFASVLELVFATSNSFKYMRLRVLDCIRYALASNRERILLDTLLFARSTAGSAMWSLDLLMEKFVYQFRDLMDSREWLAGSWGKAQRIIQAFPEQMALRRAAGGRVLKLNHKGRPIQGSDSLVQVPRFIYLDSIFVHHFNLYDRSKLWKYGSNLFLFPKGPYFPSSSPEAGIDFTSCLTLDGRSYSEGLVKRLVFEGERRCVLYAESFGVTSATRDVSTNSSSFLARNGKAVGARFFTQFNLSHTELCDTEYFENMKRYSFVVAMLMVNIPGTKRGVITVSVARDEIIKRLKKKSSVERGGLAQFDLFESQVAKDLGTEEPRRYTKKALSEMPKVDVITVLCRLRQSHHDRLNEIERTRLYPPYTAPAEPAAGGGASQYNMPRILMHRREGYPLPVPGFSSPEDSAIMWATRFAGGPQQDEPGPVEEMPQRTDEDDEGPLRLNAQEEEEDLNQEEQGRGEEEEEEEEEDEQEQEEQETAENLE
jgi:hypothetical protein